MIARQESGTHPFPQRILIASDGTVESDWVAQMGAAVARRHDGRVTLIHVESHDNPDAVQRVLSQAAGLHRALGVEPIVHVEEGRAHRLICEVAARERPSLAVLGSRRLAGVRALGSVSERVAHRASCSVLALPPEYLRP